MDDTGTDAADVAAVRRLLQVTADGTGRWPEPASSAGNSIAITMVARRRARRRAVLGAAIAAAAVIAVAVPVALASSHRRSVASGLVGPSVTAPVSTVLPGGRWTTLPTAPIVARSPAVTAWTGRQMVVWGGADGDTEYADGAAYNPSTRIWTVLPPSPLSARSDATSVWTGKYLFIWGGGGPDLGQHPDGALYDPAARRWTTLPKAPVTDFSTVQAYWTGRRVLLLSVPTGTNVNHLVLQAFDPSNHRWTHLPDLQLKPKHDGQLAGAVVAGSTFYVWSEWSHTSTVHGGFTTSDVDSYAFDLNARRWTNVQFTPPISQRVRETLWTGREALIPAAGRWCICAGPPEPHQTGLRIDPQNRSARTIPHGPVDGHSPQYFWTGSVLLAAGADNGGAAYWTPATNRWTTLPRAPLASYGAGVVWTGHSLLIWGQLSPSRHPAATPKSTGIELRE